ncbi:MAG: hypothetical protein LBN74_00560, partial [Prevotella sp.]|nr:hypothetical protein [Prevotella sp.]
MKQYIISYMFLFFLSGIPVVCPAQVVIGSARPPQKAALLDLRTADIIGSDNVSADKGLLLPRVNLVDLGSLEPFIVSANADEKREHTGLKVYNMNDLSPFAKGVYIWNGNNWDLYSSSIGSTTTTLSGSNGISKSPSALRLGGTLVKATTIDQSDYNLRFDKTTGAFSINTNALAVSGTNTGIGISPSLSTSKLTVDGNVLIKNNLTVNGYDYSSLKQTVIKGDLTIKNSTEDPDPARRYILKNTNAAGTAEWVPFSDIPDYNTTMSMHKEATLTGNGLTLTLAQWNTTGTSGERDIPGFELKLPPGRWLICLSLVVEPLSVASNVQDPIWGRFRFNYYNGGGYVEP